MANINDILSLVNQRSGAQQPPGTNLPGTGTPNVRSPAQPTQQSLGNMKRQAQGLQDKLDLSISGRAINTAANDKFPDSVRVDAINQYVKIWNFRSPKQRFREISAKQFSENRAAFQNTAKKLAGQLEMFKKGELTGPEFLQIAGVTNQDLAKELQAERPLLKKPAATKPQVQQQAPTTPKSPADSPTLTEDQIKVYTDQGISRERVVAAYNKKIGSQASA